MAAPDRSDIAESAEAVRRAIGGSPRVGIVLGSGLGGLADTLPDARVTPTHLLPHFPRSTVSGHAGRLVGGRLEGVEVLLLQGRVHGYEGYGLPEVTHAVRVMAALGVTGLLLTNAAGAMTSAFRPGTLMLVRDHVNLTYRSLVTPDDVRSRVGGGRGGGAPEGDGEDAAVYSPRVAEHAREAARALGIPLREGVLGYGRGPSYETAAEVRMYRTLGAHAACMSTVPEAVVGRLLGLEVSAVSCITNLGTGLSAAPLSHEEVTEIANQVADPFQRLIRETVRRAFGDRG